MTAKNMHKWHKSVFALLIAMAMIFSMLPVSAFAQDTQDSIILGDSDVATSGTTDGGLILTNDGEDDPNALLECDCEIRCTEEAINADCPVCATQPELCVVGVESPEIQAMAAVTADYTLEFSGSDGVLQKKTDSNTQPFTIGTDYDVNGMTLILNEGFDFTTSAYAALEVPDGTIIQINGNSKLESTAASGSVGIDAKGSLTVNGVKDKTLTVISGDSMFSYAIQLTSGGSFTMNSGTLNVTSGDAITMSTGIGATGSGFSFTMTGGTINATSGTGGGGGYGIHFITNFTMDGGTIYAEGTTNAMHVTGSVPLLGVLDIKGHDGTDYNNNARFSDGSPKTLERTSNGDAVLKARIIAPLGPLDFTTGGDQDGDGYEWNDTTKTLTLTDFEIDIAASANASAIILPAGSTIVLIGENTVNSASTGYAIEVSSGGKLTINGSGELTATSPSGISTYGLEMQGGTLTTIGTLLQSTGLTCTGDFTMTGGTIYAKGGSSGLAVQIIGGTAPTGVKITANGPDYTTTAAFSGPAGFPMTIYAGMATVKDAKIEFIIPPDYTLYYNSMDGKLHKGSLGGTVVSTDDVPGWSGSGTTLTLNGIDFTTSAATALEVPDGTTITLAGGSTNTIETTSTNFAVAIKWSTGSGVSKINGTGTLTAVNSNGTTIIGRSLTIEGSPNITAISGGNFGVSSDYTFTMKGGTLTAQAVGYGVRTLSDFIMTGGTIYAQGGSAAVSVAGSVPENIVIKGKGTSSYTVDGKFDTSAGNMVTTTMAGTPNFITDAKIILASSSDYDYTLYCNAAGVLYKDSGFATPYTEQTDKWSSSFGKLILKEGFEFETSAATALVMPAGTTIQVNGNSTITSTFNTESNQSKGIEALGALTIDVAQGKTLTVTSGSSATNYGIYASNGLTKSGKGILKATGSTGNGFWPYSWGIIINSGSFIMNGGTVYANVPYAATGDAMYVQNNNVPNNIIVMGESTPDSGTYNAEAQFTGGWIFLKSDLSTAIKAVKITVEGSPDDPGDSDDSDDSDEPGSDDDNDNDDNNEVGGTSSSTSRSGSSNREEAAKPIITPMDDKLSGTLNTAIDSAAKATSSDGKDFDVRLRNVSNFTKQNAAAIIAKAKALGKKARVSSDVMSEDGKYVEVRVTLDPELIKETVRLDGYIRDSRIFATEAKFKRFFENKTTVVNLGQEGKFGQTARIAAKVDLSGFDKNNLYLYSYDKKANTYTLITSKDYKIDANGYLVFNTDVGGDIIVSNGRLVKKSLSN